MEKREIRGQYARSVSLQREAVNEEARTVEIAISSEQPVERWFGIEILGHGAGEVALDRLADGGPVLLDHNMRDIVGVVESVRLDSDRVLRGIVRFGRSARAQEAFQDVVDGIRTKISVGYTIDAWETTKGQQGAPDTVRATTWTPLEVSFVSIPADATVGVGRAAEVTQTPASTTTRPVATEVPMEPTTAVAAPAATDTRSERVEALQLQEIASRHGLEKEAREILGSSKPLAEARGAILELVAARAAQPLPAPAPVVDLGKERFSISRAIAAHIEGRKCFEIEVSAEIAKKLGRDTAGIYVPTMQRANPPMDTATASYGQKLVFTDQGEFIDLLRAKLTVLGLGAKFLPGLRGNVGFPRQLAANTATWLGENPASAVTASALTTDLLTLSPKQLVAQSSLTRTLLAQGSPAADALINDDLAAIHALAIEVASINGAGSGSNQPLGILGTSGIGAVAGGTNGLAPTYDNIVDLEGKVATANADKGNLAYLTTPGIRAKLKKTQQFASTNGVSVWDYLVNAYPNSDTTTNVPSTLTKGTSSGICHAILFGNWADLIIGEWGAFEIITDTVTQAGKGLIVLTTNQLVDCGVRRPGSFAAMQDALT
jgi:HK97 family phage major capsid protein